jgi:lactose/L-arabinose transport system permease protein
MTTSALYRPLKSGLLKQIWRYRYAYLFISPFFIGFLVFDAFPFVFSIFLSFKEWSGFGEMTPRGIDNYRRVFNDSRFILSLKNTIYLWLGHIFIMLALALILAVILNSRKLRGKVLYRASAYLPNVTATAAMALVFGLVFDSQFGILNTALKAINLPPVPWLTDVAWAKPSIIILNVWNITGWYMILLLAGLQSIDPVIYEAAEVDGANVLQKFFYITIPSLRRIIFFAFIIETIGSFQIFTEPQVLTGGGPSNSTLSVSLYLYNTAFKYNKFGYSSAMAMVLFGIIVVASLVQTRFYRDED